MIFFCIVRRRKSYSTQPRLLIDARQNERELNSWLQLLSWFTVEHCFCRYCLWTILSADSEFRGVHRNASEFSLIVQHVKIEAEVRIAFSIQQPFFNCV